MVRTESDGTYVRPQGPRIIKPFPLNKDSTVWQPLRRYPESILEARNP